MEIEVGQVDQPGQKMKCLQMLLLILLIVQALKMVMVLYHEGIRCTI